MPSPSTSVPAHSDLVISLLRTAVPALWGSVIAILLAALADRLSPDMLSGLRDTLTSEGTVTLVVTASISLWYYVWRLLERRAPSWVARVTLGSARKPSYVRPEHLPDAERAALKQLEGVLAADAPADAPAGPELVALRHVLQLAA